MVIKHLVTKAASGPAPKNNTLITTTRNLAREVRGNATTASKLKITTVCFVD